ncbi:MAG: hypothetical protein ACKVQU_04910 [Burkholderiales bacterium]
MQTAISAGRKPAPQRSRFAMGKQVDIDSRVERHSHASRPDPAGTTGT